MKDATTVKRRSFLAAALGVPAAAVAASWLARRKAQPLPEAEPAATAPASSGYHETEHIRKYYRSADF